MTKKDASEIASALAKRRWRGTTAAERKKFMAEIGLSGGRPRLAERCYCGARSLHSATLRNFDCCKRAGVFPTEPAAAGSSASLKQPAEKP